MTQPRPLFTRRIDAFFLRVHQTASFVGRFFVNVVRRPLHAREVIRQCYEVGWRTLPLITLTGLITGIVFTKQSRPSLEAFGAASWLPSLITIAMVRSLAPLVTALVAAGKVSSSIGAELGSMKVTEQIEAMEVSAINPYKFLVVTRTLATTTMLPMLTMYFGFVGLIGAYLNIHGKEGTSFAAFLQNGFSTIEFLDLWAAVVRAILFGFTIGIIACYSGFRTTRGTEGVGRAANAAVVQSMLVVFLEEVFVVQIISWIRGG
ncbi:MAG: ABC transporter permease [Myxococcota bacterium]